MKEMNRPRRGLKKYILLPAVLAIYTVVMAVYGWERYKRDDMLGEYFAIIGVESVIIVALFFLLRHRERLRDRRREESDTL